MGITYSACNSCAAVNKYDTERASQASCGRCKSPLPINGPVTNVNGAALQSLIDKCPIPVVVDFWAPWCGPCLGFAPIFQSVAGRLAGRFVFAKANTQDYQDLGTKHHIRGIPTMIIFKEGREVTRQSGAADAASFEKWLNQF